MVISFHPNDRRLSDAELTELVRRTVTVVGLSEHQHIAVRHSDQEHEHLHMAVNKIHPETQKIHHPFRDIPQFGLLAAELEKQFGLHQVDRGVTRMETDRARDYEAQRGTESFSRWARRTIGGAIELDRIPSWQALHEELTRFGVRLVRRGNGLAVVDATRPTSACKASALGRRWSKQRLSARYGEFVRGPSSAEVAREQVKPYAERPLEQLPDDGLWRDYQDALVAARSRSAEQREALSVKIDDARHAHRRHFKMRHHAIAAMPISGHEKRKLYKMLSFERKTAERKLRATTKQWRAARVHGHPGSWKEFLAERAAGGDPSAKRRLKRQWRGLEITTRGNRLEALPSSKSRTSRGSIVHNLPGGVRLRESSGSIELLGETRDEALEQLAKVAKQRFGSKRVTLLGSRRAQERLAELAAEQGLEIAEERQR